MTTREAAPPLHAAARSAAAGFLFATATNSPARPATPPDPEARLLFACAFEMAVRRRFRPDSPLTDIAHTVADAVRRYAPVAVPALDAEMLVRDALGEVVPVEDIPLDVVLATHLVVFGHLAEELALTDEELTALIALAERRAAGHGDGPPTAGGPSAG